jgi:putative membrane-bound dehydrogenase-like protein
LPLLSVVTILCAALPCQQPGPEYLPPSELLPATIAEASSEGEDAIADFRVPAGTKIQLFAAEPMFANPVALEVDVHGRVLVAETFRQETEGVPDNRTFPEWLQDDLRLQTVEERAEMMVRHHPEFATEWTDREDRITALIDTDGDGKADVSTVFASGFSGLLDGTGAGLLARGDDVYYTCIPKLWKLTDANHDGVAESGEALHHGFGVRVAFRGHDMHGLVLGPDKRLYWSIGDRGYHVINKEGELLALPGRGAVFRSNLDGTGLEVFAIGLRNPQELAFDDYGNLFTVDNNCDAGDQARLVYVTEGSDSGWSMNFQYLPDRGPWMSEEWWKPQAEGEAHPAFLNAPIANITAGPSGLACYPGVGMGPGMENNFFVCDFRGGSSYSGIVRFTVAPEGGGFRFGEQEEFWWGMLATDMCFGPNGDMWASDWVSGWIGPGKGRIYRASFDAADKNLQASTAKLLAGDFAAMPVEQLAELLHHPDRRVRFEAQWSLVDRGELAVLNSVATESSLKEGTGESAQVDARLAELARLHATWGLGMMLPEYAHDSAVWALLADSNPRIRAAALHVLRGRMARIVLDEPTKAAIISKLRDADLKVRREAAYVVSEIRGPGVGLKLLDALDDQSSDDRFVLHAVSRGLAHALSELTLATFDGNPNSRHRLAAVLALRWQGSSYLQNFLKDRDPFIAAEAATAIYDLDITEALPALALMLANHQDLPRSMQRRAMALCNRLGQARHAQLLLDFVNSEGVDEKLLEEAREYIINWDRPQEFDPIRNESRSYTDRASDWFYDKELSFPTAAELDIVERGRVVFAEQLAAGCTKCHSIQGVTPDDVLNPAGPDLSSIGNKLTAEELRVSILDPTDTIAEGFEIRNAEGQPLAVSVMPPSFGSTLSDQEIRDLVAFLSAQKQTRRILVHVDSQGYEHAVCKADSDGLSLVERNMLAWAKEDSRYEVVVDRSYDRFTAEGLAEFDAVFFYTTGELPMTVEMKQALLDYVRGGGVFAGAHCASDTFYEWAEYGDMLGGYFDGHPWHEQVKLNVEIPLHPATKHLQSGFSFTDEIYQFRDPYSRSRQTVLLTLDTSAVDMNKSSIKRQDQDFALSWERAEGEGAVFYTALGHRQDVWNAEWFRKHLMEGILAVCARQPAPPAPTDTSYTVDLGGGQEVRMLPVTSETADTFWISETEITWDQYDRFFLRESEEKSVDGITGPSLSVFPVVRGFGHDGFPALGMTFNAAQEFCNWLNLRGVGNFRLPTQEEWLLAAGQPIEPGSMSNYAWCKVNAGEAPHAVAQLEPNEFGLYDLFGNVAEWVTSSNPKGRLMGGSFLDSLNAVGPEAVADYDISWQARDPQWPKSVWWMSDGSFSGFRIVSQERP